jgi:Zn-dependent protease with chaperone function
MEGQYFDGHSSTPQPAQLDIGADGVVRLTAGAISREALLTTVQVSDRLGRTPRRLRFDDGALFETLDNDAVDAGLELRGQRRFSGHVDRWERRWGVVIGALVAVVLISVLFIRYGIPLLANVGAKMLPTSVDRAIGVQGLDLLDRTFLDDSTLSAARQKELRDRFTQMTNPLQDGHEYRLEFRGGGALEANALALPNGIIVVTDELVALAKHDDEIVAVLAHEIGHVRERHALRMLLQSAGVAAITLALFGDVSSTSALVASIPAVLIDAKHSRDFEQEADAFAKQWLKEHGIAQQRFDDLLCRLQKDAGTSEELSFLSSHPPASERANCR